MVEEVVADRVAEDKEEEGADIATVNGVFLDGLKECVLPVKRRSHAVLVNS